jgi:regulator of nucleoside diphosphate kinase
MNSSSGIFITEDVMSERRIILNEENYAVLKKLVETLQNSGKMGLPHFARLAREMKDAIVMESVSIPDDVITIQSRVTYTYLDTDTTAQAVLGFPAQSKEADGSERKDHVSILSPFGLALIGEREGTEVEYQAPGGAFRIRIDKVEHEESQ